MPDISGLLPAATLLAGFVSKAIFDWLDHKRAIDRELRARLAARDASVAERRTEFERTTLLALQEAMLDLCRSSAQIHVHDDMEFRKSGKRYAAALLPDGLAEVNRQHHAKTTMLIVRVKDDVARELAHACSRRAAEVGAAPSTERGAAVVDQMTRLYEQLNGRIGELLRQMY